MTQWLAPMTTQYVYIYSIGVCIPSSLQPNVIKSGMQPTDLQSHLGLQNTTQAADTEFPCCLEQPIMLTTLKHLDMFAKQIGISGCNDSWRADSLISLGCTLQWRCSSNVGALNTVAAGHNCGLATCWGSTVPGMGTNTTFRVLQRVAPLRY